MIIDDVDTAHASRIIIHCNHIISKGYLLMQTLHFDNTSGTFFISGASSEKHRPPLPPSCAPLTCAKRVARGAPSRPNPPSYQKQRLATNNFTLRAAIRTRVHVTLPGMIAESRDTLRREPCSWLGPFAVAESRDGRIRRRGKKRTEERKNSGNEPHVRCRYSLSLSSFLVFQRREKDENCQSPRLVKRYYIYRKY